MRMICVLYCIPNPVRCKMTFFPTGQGSGERANYYEEPFNYKKLKEAHVQALKLIPDRLLGNSES